MADGSYTEREREALTTLTRLASERLEEETETERRHRSGLAAAERERLESSDAAEAEYAQRKRQIEADSQHAQERIDAIYEQDVADTEDMVQELRDKIAEKGDTTEQTAQHKMDEAIALAEMVYEGKEKQPAEEFDRIEEQLQARRQDIQRIDEHAETLIRRCRQRLPKGRFAPAPLSEEDAAVPSLAIEDGLRTAREGLTRLGGLGLAKLFRGAIPFFIVFFALGAAAAGSLYLNEWQFGRDPAIWIGATLVALVILGVLLHRLIGRQVTAIFSNIQQGLGRARSAIDLYHDQANDIRQRKEEELLDHRENEIATAKAQYWPIINEIAERRQKFLDRISEKYERQMARNRTRRDAAQQEAATRCEASLAALEAEHEQRKRDIQSTFERHTRETEETYQDAFQLLKDTWTEGMGEVHATLGDIKELDERLFPDWSDDRWTSWAPPVDAASVVRFGSIDVDLHQIPGGVPEDERLQVDGPTSYCLPALLQFPRQCALLLKSGGEGRPRAIATIQSVMLRLLTVIPPGKVRFTILDPVGLGQNFAGFMHLADYDGALVGDRIWTETRHIEQRLVDLTEHMENVIQKYLRNEFETIDDYNAEAGEIAEPYRFLVVADLPANFSDEAARRLTSIINSGPRCGVYTLLHLDVRQKLPPGLGMDDLERASSIIELRGEEIIRQDEELADLPLRLDEPPDEDHLTAILHQVGQAAKNAARVEVPFDVIAPSNGQCWSRSTATSVEVPLGRAGATKLQELALGHGTAQHALIAGKTGSGKSTLLHVLITNLALWYSPDEVEFYLVDFKKGVEFKTYAKHGLPHARVVAIETDREFGLSVLQRLDGELKRRGDRFRELGVQDLAGFRREAPDEPMPRSLLIVDEFQELFVEDDKLAQDGSLLLDRLVRQGRAFGIHVILGSQTLGGAYSLARATIGQMAVRIALQCNESDSYLILNDDNAAARLLARPGEAIYNDAGGLIEGNSPFQICWLSEGRRDHGLQQVADLARTTLKRRISPPIVFEGNIPANIADNQLLSDLIEADAPPERPVCAHAWLGDAIAIKDPTAAEFRRQSGANLLMVGQRDETAHGIVTGALVSLAAQHAADDAEFLILDGTPADSPLAGRLTRLAESLPHRADVLGVRDVDQLMARLSEELDRREDDGGSDAPATYLLIYGLQRFRALRAEDDFGFSSSLDSDAPPKPEKVFGRLLGDGPNLGLHTFAWIDTMNNVNRTLDRSRMREFEMRVVFQMGAADSTALIDSPLASKLGLRRALYHSEEQGVEEKFRPYAEPEEAWLTEVGNRLRKRERVADSV